MITTLIADDEIHARERLRELLGRFPAFEIIAEAHDGNEALQLIITRKPDVVFLDINMPGIPVFESIPSLQNPPLVVFQTAYSAHAAEAYDINALDYLLKPIRFERLEKTVAKIIGIKHNGNHEPQKKESVSQKPADHIAITLNGKTRIIPARDVVRISMEEGFCHIYTGGEKLISDRYLNYYEEKLAGLRFFRSSRSEIVNLDCVTAIHKVIQGLYSIELKNGMTVDVSRRKAQDLKRIVDF